MDYTKLRNKPLDFLKACGDTFVKTITTGGELTAILDVTTTAQEDTSNLIVSVSGDFAGAQGRARLAQEVQQRLANHKTQVQMIRAGGSGPLPTYSADELIKASLDFPSVVAAHPVPLQAQLASYDTITPPVELTATQQAFIKPLFRSYQRTMQILGDLTYIQSHTAEFRRIVASPSQTSANIANATAVAEFVNKGQMVVSTDFDFGDLDKQRVDQSAREQQSYADQLEALATACLTDTKAKCSGSVPKGPVPLTDIVRVFEVGKDWQTNAGPVDITLDQAYYCAVDNISGNWKPGDGRTLSCNDSLPRSVIHGHIVVGGFDNPAQYGDNVGVCSYHFVCTRR